MIVHGFRWPRHIEAKTTFGLPGCSSRSAAPVESERYSTLRQVRPPSVERKTPRSTLGANGFPSAATKTRFGLVGCTRIVAICPTSRSPMKAQVRPASVDLNTPRPIETLLRILDEPVPAYTTFGSESATSIAPIEPTGSWPSETLTQLCPASVVFQMPPPVDPM